MFGHKHSGKFCFQRYLLLGAACAVLVPVLTIALRAQTNGAKIEIEGTPSQIDPNAGTFVIEGLTVTVTAKTKYEDLHDHEVDKKSFFADLHANDQVEVEGRLKGNIITARKIEMEHR